MKNGGHLECGRLGEPECRHRNTGVGARSGASSVGTAEASMESGVAGAPLLLTCIALWSKQPSTLVVA